MCKLFGMPTPYAVASAPSSPRFTHATSSLSLRMDLLAYATAFERLSVPSEAELHGRFRAEFIGPAWLRLTAGPSVALAGLRDWWGKELSGVGPAHNLVGRRGHMVRTLPMQLRFANSLVDGRACAALRYGPESPRPWPHVVDELRTLDEARLLGMTVIDVPLLRALAFPFLLVRE